MSGESPIQSPARPRIAIIGGGISGLAAAHRARELAPEADLSVFEAAARLGGTLHTERAEGFLIEHGADNFVVDPPWAHDLCRRAGFADQLVETNPEHRRALVLCRGKLLPVPAGLAVLAPHRLWPLLTSPLLSPLARLRFLAERWVPPRTLETDESLASFARRRFGRAAYERLIQPLVGGIFTADPERLSMAAALPVYPQLERRYGSLIRAARRRDRGRSDDRVASGARYGLFVAPREGMSSLVEWLAARLPVGCVRLNSPIERIDRAGPLWQVTFRSAGGERAVETFDALIVAASAPAAAALVEPIDGQLARLLREIEYSGTTIVARGYRRGQIAHPLDAFGAVIPIVEKRQALSISFASNKFPGRAPDGCVLLRVFIGGALQRELAELDEPGLRTLVNAELAEIMGVQGEPVIERIVRWQRAMPLYHLGHLERVEEIERRAAALGAFALAGNAFRGVGVPHCVRRGEMAAESVLQSVAPLTDPSK